MGQFEFILVLVSIIIGLAMTEIFRGIARILRGDLRPYWIHSLWIFQVFLHQVQLWWSYWVIHSRLEFFFFQLLHLLLGPALLYLAAALLFPARDSHGGLRDYYYQRRKVLFLVLASLATLYFVTNWVTSGFNPATAALRVGYSIALVGLAISNRPWLHAVVAVASVIGLAGYIAVFTPDLATVVDQPR